MIGYLPELNPLYAEMKVHEYLKFHASIREITGNKFNEALKRVVKECSLQGVVHRTIGNCSKGYKQRIGLAAAMELFKRGFGNQNIWLKTLRNLTFKFVDNQQEIKNTFVKLATTL